ncbi:condensation domain-containing protein, partial [Roseateles sp. BYS180W]
MAERFAAMSADKQKAFLEVLRQQSLDFSRLPIVPARTARERLSYAQARLWFLAQLDEQSAAYHVGGALRLTGKLDRAALRGSFEALIARHESLRTVFRPVDGGLAEQQILADAPFSFVEVDVGSVPNSIEREQAAAHEARHTHDQAFDLERGPLFRVGLIRLDDEDHLLVVVMHHIVSDGWSLKIIVDEFSTLYGALSKGLALPLHVLEPLSLHYADYAAWQRSWLEAGEKDRQLAYWTAQLGEDAPALQLPTDHPRGADTNWRAARHVFELPPALVEALGSVSHAQNLTPFMALLAGWQALLHRWTGQGDIRVGVPIANRQRDEIEGVVGFFVNTQVLRAQVGPQMTLSQLLAQVREAALGAQVHQDLPFEQLVEALQPERSLAHAPLFQVMFNHQRDDHRALERLPGLTLAPWELPDAAAQFELTLDLHEQPDGRISAVLTYAAELFEPTTIERLGDHYLAMLQALAEHPEQALGEVELAGEAE